MATFRENLITRRDAIGVELAALTNVSPPEYKQALYDELARIDTILSSNSAHIDSDEANNLGPFETISRGIS